MEALHRPACVGCQIGLSVDDDRGAQRDDLGVHCHHPRRRRDARGGQAVAVSADVGVGLTAVGGELALSHIPVGPDGLVGFRLSLPGLRLGVHLGCQCAIGRHGVLLDGPDSVVPGLPVRPLPLQVEDRGIQCGVDSH